jgi:D-arabinose 1-dehydrogenase-like Zn-dependent alcohol dehydrogenase
VPEVSFEFAPLVIKGVSIHGWSSGYAMETEEAIAFAIEKDVKCMVEKFTLDQVEEAIDCMLKGEVRFRPVITFE